MTYFEDVKSFGRLYTGYEGGILILPFSRFVVALHSWDPNSYNWIGLPYVSRHVSDIVHSWRGHDDNLSESNCHAARDARDVHEPTKSPNLDDKTFFLVLFSILEDH